MDWVIIAAVFYSLLWLVYKLIDVFCNSEKLGKQLDEQARLVREQHQRVKDERKQWEAEHPEEVKKMRQAAEEAERFRQEIKHAPWA